MTIRIFEPLFHARSATFVGASNDPGKWGFRTLKHMIDGGFEGNIYPVNPKENEIQGLTAFKSITDLPDTPDLAVIIVPPPAVPAVIRECVAKGIKAGIIITAGFAETNAEGERLQKEIVETAREGGMIFTGPNCNGLMSPRNKQYIQFPSFYVPPGPIGIITQSGNVMDSLSYQIGMHGFGCSVCVASGNEALLHSEDYLEYLGDDPHTKVILSYIEGFKDGERFMEIAGRVGKKKPIVMLKAGKTQAGARAAASHTAAIAGSDAVFDAICRQSGVIRAGSLDELLHMGLAFLRQPLPKGRGLGIVTAGGGWGVMAADACEELGFDVVKLPDETIRELDKLLPAWWNRGNPVDLVAGAAVDNIFKSIELVMQCPSVDAMMFLSIMPAMRKETFDQPHNAVEREEWGKQMIVAIANAMDEFNAIADKYGKPLVVASEHMWANQYEQAAIEYAVGGRNAICYRMPGAAARVLDALVKYGSYVNRKS
ncbi:MAG: CoA-binding protein [Deltaproteobacteria bacterium]|nr:CoA-binding protein [Deltaproteobacteria bacterium]